jgi:hypothetical protein
MTLQQRVPFLRWSFWRLAVGARNITKTGEVGEGREAAAADYVVANARRGDIDDVIAKVDQFAYEKSFLINVGDEKGELHDAAVRRANPGVALELGTYCGYGSLRIARAAPSAKVFSVELSAANAEVAWRIWAHAGQPRSVDEADLVPVEGVNGRDHLDRTVFDDVDDVHVHQRRRLLDPFPPREYPFFGDRQPELAEVAEAGVPGPSADRVGDARG